MLNKINILKIKVIKDRAKGNGKDSAKGSVKGRKYLKDYQSYDMSWKEKSFYILIAALAVYSFGFLFYRNHFISIFLCPLAFLYPRIMKIKIIEKKKEELNIQFRDMLYSLSSSLTSGKSVELAFKELPEELSLLYPDNNTDIIKEVEYIVRKINMNETVEAALYDFSERSHIEDIRSFTDVFQICKRSGGNIVEVIKNTSNIINDKIEIKLEIAAMLAERRFEQKVLNLLPLLILLLLSITAGDYINPVFTTLIGRFMATIAIVLLLCAYLLSKKLMNIKI